MSGDGNEDDDDDKRAMATRVMIMMAQPVPWLTWRVGGTRQTLADMAQGGDGPLCPSWGVCCVSRVSGNGNDDDDDDELGVDDEWDGDRY